MTQQTFCGQEAHTHDESCYETILICGQDEQLPVEQPTPHVHTEDCYAARLVLVCGQAESEEHTHTEDCCQTQYELICPLEEGEAEDEPEIPAHVHTDACYETRLICEKPEHTHSLSCYADAQADLESASVWEQTIPQTLSGQWRADVVAVAESQLGYAASTRNYIVDEAGGMHGYTRYGAWYGSPYGEWCAMFASFCLHYAGVPEDSIPAQAGCIRWVEQLQALGRYAAAGAAAPQPGDLVFFDTGSDGYADHVDLEKDILKIAVVERHKGTHHIGLGYIQGYGLRSGAVATSISHDSHNIIVVGTNSADMAFAANYIVEHHGGIVVVENGVVKGSVVLEIAGIMSDRPLTEVNDQLEAAKAAAFELGVSRGIDPFMTLSFMALPVIPKLRITTRGVIDVETQQYV